MFDVADICKIDVVTLPTTQVCAKLSVKLPATVRVIDEFIVAVAVYPEVKVMDKIVIFADNVLLEFPLVPAPSNITSSAEVGGKTLSATPLALPQFVIPPEL
jgi:hypothetical protein